MGIDVVSCVILMIGCIGTISGFQYKCHQDICDSSWQFCNDGEERCNTCTPEQCEKDVAEYIFNQCETLCKSLLTTSTVSASTANFNPAPPIPVPSESQDVSLMSWILTTAALVLLLVLLVISGITFKYVREVRNQQLTDVERGTTTEYCNTIQSSGEAEKVPLLETGVQVTASSPHFNKMNDIEILHEAISNVGQPDKNDGSAPPSYATDDKLREHSQSPVPCCDDQQPGLHNQVTVEQDNGVAENMGEPNLLLKGLPSDSESVTRPKCV